MIKIRFSINTTELRHKLENMRKTIYQDRILNSVILAGEKEFVEKNIKERLRANSTADPSLTKAKKTGAVAAIRSNITSELMRDRKRQQKLGASTGKIFKMDAKDPISEQLPTRSLTSLSSDGIMKLWRILEWGHPRHPIFPRMGARQTSQENVLFFYFKKIGRWLKSSKPVDHPGAKGRRYFFQQSDSILGNQVLYETDKAVIPHVLSALRNYIIRNSWKGNG